MLRPIIILFILFSSSAAIAQDKVVWSFSYDSASEMVIADAEIEKGWHLYSQHVDENAGPVPTAFRFETVKGVKLIGQPIEPEPIVEYDENFESEVLFFKGHVQFKQKIKSKKNGQLTGAVTFMVCDDTMCLPPVDKQFTISIQR